MQLIIVEPEDTYWGPKDYGQAIGRNGEFTPREVVVEGRKGTVQIRAYSKRKTENAPLLLELPTAIALELAEAIKVAPMDID